MKKEKSCGAVIYKIENRIIKYLILHMGLGHISLCKGHVEENESEEETAYREIKEETSLEVKIDINFRKVITYSPKENVIKDVVFFVAEAISKNKPIDNHDDEVLSFEWLEINEAINSLTFPSDKETLNEANSYIIKNLVNN